MNKDSEDYKQGFIDGLNHARKVIITCLDGNIEFHNILSSIRLKGDNAFILSKNKEDKK